MSWRLPDHLLLLPGWFVPVIELGVLALLILSDPLSRRLRSKEARIAMICLLAFMSIVNLGSLMLLISHLLHGSRATTARALIYAAFQIWVTSTIVFGLWFWELDAGGPGARRSSENRRPDLLFPQMTARDACKDPHWKASFVDYLFVAFTNATAFSPTDTLPLTPVAKILMMLQASTSLLTITFVTARAVNILD